MKSFNPIVATLALCALVISDVSPALADITMTTHMTMTMPKSQSKYMTPQMQEQMDKYSTSTTYISNHKMRSESAFFTMISDQDVHKMWMLNPTAHTYTVMSFDPNQFKQMMQSSSPNKVPSKYSSNTNYKVTDTGRTTTILGHVARHYIMKMTMVLMGKRTVMISDILAAQDIPADELGAYSQAFSSTAKNQIHGLPLITTTRFVGGSSDGMTMKQEITSLTTDPIPDSTFAVPDGYTQTTTKGLYGNLTPQH